MNFEQIDKLPEFGFYGGVTIARLQVTCEMVPPTRGIYLVARNNGMSVDFLTESCGGKFKRRSPTVEVEILKSRWLPGRF